VTGSPLANPGQLRILIGADTFPPNVNGAAHFANRLAGGLAARGHEVHVVCPEADGENVGTELHGVTVHRLRSVRTPFHPTFRICLPWRVSRAIDNLVDNLAPDLVHVQAHFAVGRAAVMTAVRRGVPVVATNHFMPENLLGYGPVPAWLHAPVRRLAWRDLSRVYRHAEVVTAPTPRAVRLLRDNGVREDATAISCGMDLERFRAGAPVERGPSRTVLFVGRLDEEKRIDELIAAMALLPAELDARLELVGDGVRRAAWEALAARLGIADRVTFHGLVGEDELVRAYQRCDLFCMPGTAELQSLATMEAMAAGKAVVAADAMALPHLVHPGRNGWLYPPGDVPALAARMAEVLADREVVDRMGRASQEIVAEHDIDVTLRRFEDIYHRALRLDPAPVGPDHR
jgi:glycosyltransferase involved in cell wall biosynthesis